MLLLVATATGCKHPAGPYGWPTPDGWVWTDDCHGWSVTDGAARTICVDPAAVRHDFVAAHELAHAWDMVLGSYPNRLSYDEGERVAWCVAELLTGHLSTEWIGGVRYSINPAHACPRTGVEWSDAQLIYMVIVG